MSSRSSTISSLTGASRRSFGSTTAQSSPDACSTSGLSERCGAGLLQARNTNRQCVHRSLQRPYSGQVSQCQLVLLTGRCPGAHRGVAARLQHRAASLGPGSLDAQGLRSASSTRPNDLMTFGPDSGARPSRSYTNIQVGPPSGGRLPSPVNHGTINTRAKPLQHDMRQRLCGRL
jgi:hypothetical protein